MHLQPANIYKAKLIKKSSVSLLTNNPHCLKKIKTVAVNKNEKFKENAKRF